MPADFDVGVVAFTALADTELGDGLPNFKFELLYFSLDIARAVNKVFERLLYFFLPECVLGLELVSFFCILFFDLPNESFHLFFKQDGAFLGITNTDIHLFEVALNDLPEQGVIFDNKILCVFQGNQLMGPVPSDSIDTVCAESPSLSLTVDCKDVGVSQAPELGVLTLHEIEKFNAALKLLFLLGQVFDYVGHVYLIAILMHLAR